MSEQKYPIGWPEESDWTDRLREHFQSQTFVRLSDFVQQERESKTIYPSAENVFSAFRLTPYVDVKAVILGQDPYHGPNQAHGLSFSVEGDVKLPPSLKNIYKELADDLGCQIPASGNLSGWATQGVFLLNTVLTVQSGQANSHRKKGWEIFTDLVIRELDARENPIVFVLWGKPAEKKLSLIGNRHAIITSPHPSPLSAYRGFFGSRPFSRVNEQLKSWGSEEIDWTGG